MTPGNSKLFSLSTSSLDTNWEVDLGATNTGPAFSSGGAVYLAAGLEAKEVLTSGSVGHTYSAGDTVRSGPIELNNVVYFGRDNGRYCAFGRTTETAVGDWPYITASGDANVGPWISPANEDSLVIFGTSGNNLDAFWLE
ncbi:MAG: hypothetical protein GF418_04620 [Chitinivibrionales bacterium]|nr:hypothetical protein [Chitinivibrionales bacterium]